MIKPEAKATAAKTKKDLKAKYPGVKFSVQCSMSGWLTMMRVSWVDGPTEREIDQIVRPLAGWEFDKNNDDSWNKIEGVDTGITMVQTSRQLSGELRSQVESFLAQTFDGWRFSHKDEFVEAIGHLWGEPKSWAELADNDTALYAITTWVANASPLVPGLVKLWDDCADF